MNTKMLELDESGLGEINGGLAWGLTVWGGVVLVIANWSEIKSGFADGWHDAGL